MKTKSKSLISFCLICILLSRKVCFVQSKITHIRVPKDLQCDPGQYFDHSGLICVQCGLLSHPIHDKSSIYSSNNRGAGCECDESSIQENEVCSLDEMRGGLCTDITCTPKCNTLSKPTSLDSLACTTCNTTNLLDDNATNTIARYDETSGRCTCDNPLPVSTSGSKPVSNRKLVETYNPVTGDAVGKECKQCPKNSAVITKDILQNGEEFHITSGLKFLPNPHECVHCPDPSMYFDANYQCKCDNGYMIVGETSIGPQRCLKYTPSYSSNYDKVTFPFIQTDSGSDQGTQLTLNSIIFSHYYLEAASLCEFPASDSIERSLNACQTLANLCVMNYYDKSTEPCSQFQYIASKRLSNYHNQGEWKQMMPWLYYDEEVDDIVEDRGIQMSMSFREQEGYEYKLRFKVAKYSLDGKLIGGLEHISNQFVYCNNIEQYSSDVSSGFRFGFALEFEFQCNINDMMNEEMFFYDLYIEDAECVGSNTDQNDCIYPVPVLNRNYIAERNKLPNQNNYFGDEFDDRYTRRFFLFDNMVSFQEISW